MLHSLTAPSMDSCHSDFAEPSGGHILSHIEKPGQTPSITRGSVNTDPYLYSTPDHCIPELPLKPRTGQYALGLELPEGDSVLWRRKRARQALEWAELQACKVMKWGCICMTQRHGAPHPRLLGSLSRCSLEPTGIKHWANRTTSPTRWEK